jgi:3-hydroxybutyryl-CoA dehydrogenase
MGNGIAHVFALAGYDVLLNDIRGGAEKRRATDREEHRPAGRARQDQEEDRAPRWPASAPPPALADLGPTDLIIEAATERETVKQAIFEDLLPHLKPHTILTSNTSSISITRLASRTDRPERSWASTS